MSTDTIGVMRPPPPGFERITDRTSVKRLRLIMISFALVALVLIVIGITAS